MVVGSVSQPVGTGNGAGTSGRAWQEDTGGGVAVGTGQVLGLRPGVRV